MTATHVDSDAGVDDANDGPTAATPGFKLNGSQPNLCKHSDKKHAVKANNLGAIYANVKGLFPRSNQTNVPYFQDLKKLSNDPIYV